MISPAFMALNQAALMTQIESMNKEQLDSFERHYKDSLSITAKEDETPSRDVVFRVQCKFVNEVERKIKELKGE